MKWLNHPYIALFCLLVISIAPQVVSGQERTPRQQGGEIETLRRQLEDQKAQIQQLQVTLQKQEEQREQQQQLLERLQQKLETLDNSAVSPDTAPAGPTGTPSPMPTPAQETATAEVATAQAQSAKPETQPAKTAGIKRYDMKAGGGRIKFDGLLQGWYASGNGGFSDSFRIRRTELKFTGEVTPEIKWTIMIDPSKALSLNNTFTTINGATVLRDTSVNQASRILQDAYITLSYFKRMSVNVGQFKLPLSMEGMQSSAALDTVERPLFASDRARGGNLADIRDLGIMAYGPLTKQIDYHIGFFNGGGENQNDVDKNDQKAVAGHMIFRPTSLKGLQIGGSGLWGNGQRADRPRRDRLGGEFLFVRHGVTLKSEVMTGKDGDLHRLGYYGHLGYRFRPRVEGIFRFDSWDPDRRREFNAANVTERDFITGLNYYIKENQVKLQFNYLRKTFADHIVASRNLLLINLQTSW
jgi:phosphate-selective porin